MVVIKRLHKSIINVKCTYVHSSCITVHGFAVTINCRENEHLTTVYQKKSPAFRQAVKIAIFEYVRVLKSIIGSVTYNRRTLERSVKIIDESERDELVRKVHAVRKKRKPAKHRRSSMHGKWMKNVYGR